MSEYEQLKQMHYQEYLLRQHKVPISTKWQKACKLLKHVIITQPDIEKELTAALEIAVNCLTKVQSEIHNPPLKKVQLEKLNGEPVWVVSETHDGRWGIIEVSEECVIYPALEIGNDKVDFDCWFMGCYIFRYKKGIIDYSKALAAKGITMDNDYDRYFSDYYLSED